MKLKNYKELIDKGAKGIILGCTEIGMLIKDNDLDATIFDTTIIHVNKAIELAVT